MKAIRTIVTLVVAVLMSSCLAGGRNAISMDYRSCAWSVHFFVPDKPSKAVTLKSTDFECERISRKVFRYTHPDAVVVLDWSASGGKKLEEAPFATREYSRQVLDLKRRYADALMYGTFKDNLGLKLETDGSLVAKRFEAADKSYNAVVVWNTSSTEAASYELKFKGHKVKSVDSPEGSAEAGTIAPDSVHVLIYQ